MSRYSYSVINTKMYSLVKCALVLCAAVAASSFDLGAADVVFHLYTRSNPTVSQPLLPNLGSIASSSFGLQRPTIVTIHDHGEGVSGNFNAFVVPGHLFAEDVNVIAVDWFSGASKYTEGLGNAPQCGRVIAEFINMLVNSFGYNLDLIRIVGVGLGGHIAGIAARNVNGVIPHIIALDPSFHGWSHHPDILGPDAANIVEVLHTTAGLAGYDYPLGHIDFYPNGGSAQSGCGALVSCSHIYSYVFYAESIERVIVGGNEFVGSKCDTYESATTLSCDGERDAVFGGTDTKTSGSGIYTFVTNFVPPFAQG